MLLKHFMVVYETHFLVSPGLLDQGTRLDPISEPILKVHYNHLRCMKGVITFTTFLIMTETISCINFIIITLNKLGLMTYATAQGSCNGGSWNPNILLYVSEKYVRISLTNSNQSDFLTSILCIISSVAKAVCVTSNGIITIFRPLSKTILPASGSTYIFRNHLGKFQQVHTVMDQSFKIDLTESQALSVFNLIYA